jgi:MbtH protein
MTNPFERDDIQYLVLVNDEGQHSLWPSFVDVPEGWTQVFDGGRQECVEYVDANWTDMRPKSLVRSMEGRD